MIMIFRIFFIFIFSIILCFLGTIWCLLLPRNYDNVAIFGRLFGKLSYLFGIKLEIRKQKNIKKLGNVIYISNHQNNYDMITASNIIEKSTVTVGKKSIIWIPFFGILYWLSGNLLINRNNKLKARNTIHKLTQILKKKKISFWLFPEGTRSYKKELLPFKTGAFRAALLAKVPIIPIVISDTNKIKLNSFKNGLVIIEMLMPINIDQFKNNSVHKLTKYCYQLMKKKLFELNTEVEEREKYKKI